MAETSADGILRYAILTMSSRRPHRPGSTNRTPARLPAPRHLRLVQTGAEAKRPTEWLQAGWLGCRVFGPMGRARQMLEAVKALDQNALTCSCKALSFQN